MPNERFDEKACLLYAEHLAAYLGGWGTAHLSRKILLGLLDDLAAGVPGEVGEKLRAAILQNFRGGGT